MRSPFKVSESKTDSETSITASDWIGAFKGPNACAQRFRLKPLSVSPRCAPAESLLNSNMAAATGLGRVTQSVWQKILTVVNNALVYLDTPAAELLHWTGSVQNILDAGALAIFDVSSGRVSEYKH